MRRMPNWYLLRGRGHGNTSFMSGWDQVPICWSYGERALCGWYVYFGFRSKRLPAVHCGLFLRYRDEYSIDLSYGQLLCCRRVRGDSVHEGEFRR